MNLPTLLRTSFFTSLLMIFGAVLQAQTEVPEQERERTLTPAALGGDQSWVDSISIQTLSFFEKGRGEVPVDERQYQTEFDQTETRYVAWEVRLQHPPAADQRLFNMEAVFYGPEGRELGRIQHEAVCAAGETSSVHSQGWGWPDPGFWDEGTYRVAFYIGERKIGDQVFSIIRSSEEITREEWLRALKFDFLQFYEKGKKAIPYTQRVYRSWFDQQTTRYIAWELHLEHPVATKAMALNLQAIYYFPDGRVFGRDEIKSWVEPHWPTSWHTSGWGWPEPGYWKTGIYRVEFYLDGQQLATEYFEIR